MIDIADFDFVPRYYVAHPDEDVIIFDGLGLRDGMMVLIEDPDYRQTIDPTLKNSEERLTAALRDNRWCTVSEVQITDEDTISFIATYQDETQRKRNVVIDEGWIVKKNSIPEDERLKSVRAIIRSLLGDSPVSYDGPDVRELTATAAAEILEVFLKVRE